MIQVADLWTLARLRPYVDPNDLTVAIERQIAAKDLDYRSRLLIRDSIDALKGYWGPAKFAAWYDGTPMRGEIETICSEEFDKVGFPSMRRAIMDRTTPDQIQQYLERLGRKFRKETVIEIAGSCALILPGLIDRGTDDIDIVDEVPREIRERPDVTDDLERQFRLHLGHVQTHYFPAGWRDRTHYFDRYDRLTVRLVDKHDVFLSKLFSARVKDHIDLDLIVGSVDKETLVDLLKRCCDGFLCDERLKQLATDNWRSLFKEDLPL
jgi:Nucleotidyltransferase of unknown function (DUF6036)